jgi:glucose/arabinose dehydrogenase
VVEPSGPTRPRTPRTSGPAGPGAWVVGVAAAIALVIGVVFVLDGDDDGTTDVDAGAPSTVSIPNDATAPTSPDTTDDTDPDATSPTTVAVEAHPLPALASFENQGIRLEPTVSIPLLTGMVWNEREGAYYAISQDGLVHTVDRDLTTSEVVLDLSAEVTEFQQFSERGMLGIAFDPRDGRLVLDYTDPQSTKSTIASFGMVDGLPDPADRRTILEVAQPGLGHKGGQLAFDADGNLLIAFGDGGGSRGRDAQDMTKLLGAIVRITPRPDGDGYTIPDSNPFVGQEGIAPEIYAKGLRNPWRFSIDPPTGDIWLGDVGEATWEEIDRIPAGTAGQNFGWYWKEGNSDYNDGAIDGLVAPLFEYRHDEYGPAVIGGFVYHGAAIPALRGAYVFADMSGPMFALGADGTARLNVADETNGVITSFVVTPEQELLVITQNEAIYRVLAA